MDQKILGTVGKIAGIGGLALGVFLLLFQGVLSKQILPSSGLTEDQGFLIILTLMLMTFGIATIGLVSWIFSKAAGPGGSTSSIILVVAFAAVVLGVVAYLAIQMAPRQGAVSATVPVSSAQ